MPTVVIRLFSFRKNELKRKSREEATGSPIMLEFPRATWVEPFLDESSLTPHSRSGVNRAKTSWCPWALVAGWG